MALVRFSYGGDGIAMLTRGKPIEQFCPDRATLVPTVCGIDGARAAGNQQHDARAHSSRLRHTAHQPRMCAVEIMAVQIQSEFRRDIASFKLAVPVTIKPSVCGRMGGPGTVGCWNGGTLVRDLGLGRSLDCRVRP